MLFYIELLFLFNMKTVIFSSLLPFISYFSPRRSHKKPVSLRSVFTSIFPNVEVFPFSLDTSTYGCSDSQLCARQCRYERHIWPPAQLASPCPHHINTHAKLPNPSPDFSHAWIGGLTTMLIEQRITRALQERASNQKPGAQLSPPS